MRTAACIDSRHGWCPGALKESATKGSLPCTCPCHKPSTEEKK